jgi:hypothetical protein
MARTSVLASTSRAWSFQVVFNQLLDKIPTMRLAVDFEELRFKESAIVYGLEALPIAW